MFLVIKKKTIAFVLAGLLAAAGLIFSLSGANAAAVYFGTSLRKIPIYRVDTQEKKIAPGMPGSRRKGTHTKDFSCQMICKMI